MKKLVGAAVLIFVGAAGWQIGSQLSSDAIGMALGVFLGVMAGLPAALLMLVASRGDSSRQSTEPSRPHLQQGRHGYPQHFGAPQPPVIVVTGSQGMQQVGQQGYGQGYSQGYGQGHGVQQEAQQPMLPDSRYQMVDLPPREFRVVGEEDGWGDDEW